MQNQSIPSVSACFFRGKMCSCRSTPLICNTEDTDWKGYSVKRAHVKTEGDLSRNFLTVSLEKRAANNSELAYMEERATSAKKSPFLHRLQSFVSYFCSDEEIVLFERGNVLLASMYFNSCLFSASANTKQTLVNQTAHNPLHIYRCRQQHSRYRAHVNKNECLVNVSWIRQDFEKIELQAGEAFVLEPYAIYFWYAIGYSLVMRHTPENKTTDVLPEAERHLFQRFATEDCEKDDSIKKNTQKKGNAVKKRTNTLNERIGLLRKEIQIQKKEFIQQKKENTLQRREISQQKKEISKQMKEISQLKNEVQRHKNEANLLKKEIEVHKKEIKMLKSKPQKQKRTDFRRPSCIHGSAPCMIGNTQWPSMDYNPF